MSKEPFLILGVLKGAFKCLKGLLKVFFPGRASARPFRVPNGAVDGRRLEVEAPPPLKRIKLEEKVGDPKFSAAKPKTSVGFSRVNF